MNSNYKGIKKYDHVSLWGKRDTVIIKEVVDSNTFLDAENSIITIDQINKRLHPFPKYKTVHGVTRTLKYGLLSDIAQMKISPSRQIVCIFFVMQELTDDLISEITKPFVNRNRTSFYVFGKQDMFVRERMQKLYSGIDLDIKIGDYLNTCRVWKSQNEVFDEDAMRAWAVEAEENNAEFLLLELFQYYPFISHTGIFFAADNDETLDNVLTQLAFNLGCALQEKNK